MKTTIMKIAIPVLVASIAMFVFLAWAESRITIVFKNNSSEAIHNIEIKGLNGGYTCKVAEIASQKQSRWERGVHKSTVDSDISVSYDNNDYLLKQNEILFIGTPKTTYVYITLGADNRLTADPSWKSDDINK